MLVHLKNISKSFGAHTLFSGLTLAINQQERLALIGANGSGKSTLIEIMADTIEADDGEIIRKQNLQFAFLKQHTVFEITDTIEQAITTYVTHHMKLPLSDEETQQRIGMYLHKAGFHDPQELVSKLSGGWKKRLAIAACLAIPADLYFLDEPTNHLDLEGLNWLEQELNQHAAAFVVISHDRTFLDKTVKRIVEINPRFPGGFWEAEGTYQDFIKKRLTFIENQQAYTESLANKVRREEEWLQHGPKARTTKAKGRIDQAHRLQTELQELRSLASEKKTSIQFIASGRKTKRLLVAYELSKAFGDNKLFSNLDLILQPGLHLGLAGPNGCGKSTLLKIIAGQLPSDTGELLLADNLRIVYFDQQRENLDQNQTLQDSLANGSDKVFYNDRDLHVVSYAKRFGFEAEQLKQPVWRLSGGEQAKLLIARLMLQPADVLLLDEPTNDLDLPALQVLEESLTDFPGALVLVTHDRSLLDAVCNATIGFLPVGKSQVFSDYHQYHQSYRMEVQIQKDKKVPNNMKIEEQPKRKKALTYGEELELEKIEEKILKAEEFLASIQLQMENPSIQSDTEQLAKLYEQQNQAQITVDAIYQRWNELESKKQQ